MEVHIKNSEEFKGITTIFLSNGHKITFDTFKLENFVVVNELNVYTETCWNGLTCDPNCVERIKTITIPVDKYIDDNWDKVVDKYYNQVICK